MPAGQVGIWCGDASDNSFDDFKVLDAAGPYEVDGRWCSDVAGVRVDNTDSNVLEVYESDGLDTCVVRRGFRGEKFVATRRFKWTTGRRPGFVVRYQDPGNWLAVVTRSGTAILYKRQDEGPTTTLATGSSVTLTSGQWYTAKTVIDDDPQNSALQRLRVWVDANRSGSFADPGENVLDTTAVDDIWSAGLVGLFKQSLSTATHEFDDLKLGCDTNGDGDIDDAGDDLQIEDSFDSRPIDLGYDANGNLTDEGCTSTCTTPATGW